LIERNTDGEEGKRSPASVYVKEGGGDVIGKFDKKKKKKIAVPEQRIGKKKERLAARRRKSERGKKGKSGRSDSGREFRGNRGAGGVRRNFTSPGKTASAFHHHGAKEKALRSFSRGLKKKKVKHGGRISGEKKKGSFDCVSEGKKGKITPAPRREGSTELLLYIKWGGGSGITRASLAANWGKGKKKEAKSGCRPVWGRGGGEGEGSSNTLIPKKRGGALTRGVRQKGTNPARG